MLKDIFKEDVDFSISLKKSDLLELFEEIANRQKAIEAPKAESYITVDEACKALGVNRSTMWRWNNTGYLLHIEVGGKRRYKQSDINRILEGGRK